MPDMVNQSRLDEIESRLAELDGELRSADDSKVDELCAEVDTLAVERTAIIAAAEKRQASLDVIARSTSDSIRTIKNESEDSEERKDNETMSNTTNIIDTIEYRNAWLKYAQFGSMENLNAEERSAMTSATTSAGYAIPTETANKIITNLTKIAPMMDYAQIMHVPANLVLPVEGTVNAAGEHTEASAITPADDTINRLELGAHEIVKLVEISEKVKAMAVPAFEAWITEQLARKLAEEIDNRMINGDGGRTVQSHGINSAETWIDGTNAVDWAAAAPTVTEIITAIGLVPAAYATNAKFIVNHKTFWTKIFTLRDDKFEPVVTTVGDKRYVFGYEVIIDDKVANDVIFVGDPYEGLVGNFAEDISIQVHPNFDHWSMQYRGTCLFDCVALAGRWVKCAATI